jgi:hypothetical protein
MGLKSYNVNYVETVLNFAYVNFANISISL